MQRLHSVSSIYEPDSERQTIAATQTVKPLPPLPRGWPRVCHETGLFLRGIGLGIVVTSFQGLFAKNFLEPKKVAIRQSRITAILRTLIHAVPIGVAIFEIILNFKGHFVGSTFKNQGYLQFAAKAHETAMQASIATILLSYIRYQISLGKGIPFGAVLGGLQFLQVSYLWSVELWSSILSKDFQLRRKSCFAVLILICVTIAATAGPSSASLLIARQGLWPTTSTYLAINASFLDMWPDRLDDKKIERDCATVRIDSLNSNLVDSIHCPLSDLYTSLQSDHVSIINESWSSVVAFGIQTPGTDFSRNLMTAMCQTSLKDQYCASIPHSVLVDAYFAIEKNRFVTSDFEGYQFMEKNYYQPHTIASCVADVVKDASDETPLRFARISETNSELQKDREIISVPGLLKGQIIKNVSGDNSNFRVDWVDLPTDVFDTGIPGAVIVNPQDLNSSSYNITTCTLNAGWGSSNIMSSSWLPAEIYSHMSNIPSSWPDNKIILDAYGYMFANQPNFANISNFSYPQRRISVSKDWMQFLNPTVVLANNSTESYLSYVLSLLQSQSTSVFQPTEANLARLLNLVLAVGMSNTGIEYDWEGFSDSKNATRTCNTCLVFEIEYWFYGWLYSSSGTTTQLAITVMLAYCVLVFGHIIYSAVSGVSSTAWDSSAELVALAMNSSPTETLQNTCAGIVGRQALKTPVRVLATDPGHLELVFGEVKNPNAQTSELMMNEKYGKLTDEGHNDDEDPESNVHESLRKRTVPQKSE